MKSYFVASLPVLLLALLNYVQAQGITKISPCIGELDDGRRVDLTSLDDQRNPLSAINGDYNYKYNPCKPIPCGSGGPVTAAACQNPTKGGDGYNIGTLTTAEFSLSGGNTIISFSASPRSSKLICTCGDIQSFTASEPATNNYELRLTHHCCCPNVGGCKKGGGGGLSFGSVLVIIFFSLLAAYLIGGIIFMKFVKKAEGKQMIPNYEFWVSVPSDFKAGISFTVSKIKGDSSGQYSSI